MHNLVVAGNNLSDSSLAFEIYQLDVSVIDRLSSRNSKRGLSQGAKQTYKTAINDYNRFLAERGRTVCEQSLQLYFDSIKDKLKPATLNLRKYALLKCIKAQIGGDSTLRNLAIECSFQQIDIYKTSKAIRQDECLSELEVKRLINHAPTERTRLIIKFLFVTGCRVSEMIGVRLSDCEPVNRHIKIRILGKGNKERFVGIPPNLYDEIRRGFQGNKWLFSSRSGRQLHRVNVYKQLKNVGRKLGLEISPHSLRHARANDLLLNKGFSLKAVSRHLGHSSTAITSEMYIHDSIDFLEMFSKDMI
ncbi:TPA: hypothetical protein EYP66_19570 [Candidatus Poribacteria bacterium]|nr:hypothetical protein [Candidatus Poribacteria bacterium]